jgi:hypothetical protein
MSINTRIRVLLTVLLAALSGVISAGQAATPTDPVGVVQRKITAYLVSLANMHCTESVTQQKLSPSGHVEATERAKYDYLIMMDGSGDDFQLNETRVADSSGNSKVPPESMLVSNGLPTVLLVFHPYYRDSFKFEAGVAETVDGKTMIPIHFEHIRGRRTPAALALRGREYPLELKGTAWLDVQSGEVVKIDASLLNDMSDVGLRSLQVHVEYKPVTINHKVTAVDLPALAVVDVTTPHQHWRNTHIFDGYKSFSIDVEQDPTVKVRSANPTDDKSDSAVAVPVDPKEKH